MFVLITLCPYRSISDVGGTWSDGDEDEKIVLVGIGEKISLICTVTNEGTTALLSSCITSDYFVGDVCLACPQAATLAPGESFKCTVDLEVRVTWHNGNSVLL